MTFRQFLTTVFRGMLCEMFTDFPPHPHGNRHAGLGMERLTVFEWRHVEIALPPGDLLLEFPEMISVDPARAT